MLSQLHRDRLVDALLVRPAHRADVECHRLALALALFRFFDIVKPVPLPQLEQRPGGWGIMADDAGAAAYTISVLFVVRALTHWLR